MTFMPRMRNRIEGFTVLAGPRTRSLNGIAVDLWDVTCADGAGGYYVGRDPRLIVPLDAEGDGSVLMTRPRGQVVASYRPPVLSYIPAEMELWARLRGIHRLRHLDLHFDAEVVARRISEDVDKDRLAEPRLDFTDERMLTLARLLAAECADADPLHDLYADSLAISLLIQLFRIGPRGDVSRGGLASWQLRRALDHIEANCLRSVRLEELAALTNLSMSHFSRAFKASIGMPPHRWQMKARIEQVKAMLLDPRLPLTEIAAATGFSDQAHFTRVFRKMTGLTPLVWRRDNTAAPCRTCPRARPKAFNETQEPTIHAPVPPLPIPVMG